MKSVGWTLLVASVQADTIRLPTLDIDNANVVAAGFDHSADFAHQLHIAFSSVFSGSCLFAAQPWNCAGQNAWILPSLPGHCKEFPGQIDVGALVDDPRRRCGQNPISKTECADPVEYFFDDKVFVFRGTHDDVYRAGSVENTVALLAQMLHDPASSIKHVLDQPFGHVLPLRSTPHHHSSHPAGYDGPGECLNFVFGNVSEGTATADSWAAFDQTEFAEAGVGFQEQGWIYIPKACEESHAQCKMLVRADTCAPPETVAPDVMAFADYAEANGIVLLHPCVGGAVDKKRFPHAKDVKRGKLDVTGELTKDYVEQSAPHMRAVGRMVRRVLGLPDVPPPAPVPPHLPAPKADDLSGESLSAFGFMDLPTLKIDRSSVTTAGCSNTADFAHQFHVAFSSLVTSACVFSGQPYHCAATRFPKDYMVPKTMSTAAGIHCPDCEDNGTLIYDHCKNHPDWVNVSLLAEYAEQAANVDDPRQHLASARAFVFGPTHDRCYQPPAMANVADFYRRYATQSTQIQLVDDQPFPHTLPTNGTPYFNSSEPAGYDGPGHCLKHVFYHDQDMRPAVPALSAAEKRKFWKRIDALKFVPRPFEAGMSPTAWLFLPPQCETGECKLIILPGGCQAFVGGPPGGSTDDFARYGLANGIVILNPCQGNPINPLLYPGNRENRRGMVDVYGQMTADYATQTGAQMEPIGNMLKHILGISGDTEELLV